MQRILRLFFSAIFLFLAVSVLQAQANDTIPTSIDPKLLEWKNARIPKEYTIANVEIRGIRHLDTTVVYSITNLQPGDKFMHPGEDIFAKAISNLWRQKLFSNVQVYVTRVEDNK